MQSMQPHPHTYSTCKTEYHVITLYASQRGARARGKKSGKMRGLLVALAISLIPLSNGVPASLVLLKDAPTEYVSSFKYHAPLAISLYFAHKY